MTIPWITIRVRDIEAAKRFYGDFLGLPLRQAFSPSPLMQIAFFGLEGETQIELICDSAHPLPPVSSAAISLGFMPKDYDGLLKACREAGALTSEPAVIGGHLECFFAADPDGTGIQIVKERL